MSGKDVSEAIYFWQAIDGLNDIVQASLVKIDEMEIPQPHFNNNNIDNID